MIGNNTKSVVEEYEQIVMRYNGSDTKGYKQVLKETDTFVKRRIVFQLTKTEYISREKNRLNRAEWKKTI